MANSTLLYKLEAQANIDIAIRALTNRQLAAFFKLEEHLRNAVLNFRQKGLQPSVEELIDFITTSAEKFRLWKFNVEFLKLDVAFRFPTLIFQYRWKRNTGYIYITSLYLNSL